jgi:hypothetical protein
MRHGGNEKCIQNINGKPDVRGPIKRYFVRWGDIFK